MTKIQMIIFGALFVACIALMWKVDSQSKKIDKITDERDTALETIKKHEDNKRITENATNKYLGQIAILNDDINRLLKRPVRCVTVTRPSTVHNGQGQGGEYDGDNGVRSDWLYDYSAKAEKLRIERNACKDFVNEVWDGFNR